MGSPIVLRRSPTPSYAQPWSCVTTSWEKSCAGKEAELMTPDVACSELYVFGCAGTNRRGATADVVGNKGANLIRMAEAWLPVPPGFVLPTSLCRSYRR